MSSPPKIVGISSIKYRYFRLRQQQGMLLGFARLESAYDPGYLEIPIEIEIGPDALSVSAACPPIAISGVDSSGV